MKMACCGNSKGWSRRDFLKAIMNKTFKKKRRNKRGPKISGNKIMDAVMLGHMLGKNNKNAVQKKAVVDMMSSSQMTGMGRVWKKFMSSHYPLPQKQIKQLVRDRKLIESIFNLKVPLDTRRHILKQKGAIFPALFPIVAKVIGSSLLGPIIGKILK